MNSSYIQLNNESTLTSLQVHFLRTLLDGKKEISEEEAKIRVSCLRLRELKVPCAVVCISPYYTNVPYQKKDEAIRASSDYISRFFYKVGYTHYCLTNAYDDQQVLLCADDKHLKSQELDSLCISLREKFYSHFGLELFIGIGSVVDGYSKISKSAQEAIEMLAFKNQYADRGVISVVNTFRFKHYSVYGEDIMFARVLGCFQDGNLSMMTDRLNELIESVRYRPNVSKTAIKRTFIELVVNVLHIASNANVDVDSVLDLTDFYTWILNQNHTEVIAEWFLGVSAKLMSRMENQQKSEETEAVKQACDYIERTIGDPNLSLQSVSDTVGLSVSYFSQIFKKEKGIGLNNYIMRERITRAQYLLKTSELKSEDIARQLGFASATYFGRVFKKNTGITPSAYRKQSRQLES